MTRKKATQMIEAFNEYQRITRRDDLAKAAMQGIASSWLINPKKFLKPSGVAKASYELADAMIVESRR